MKNRQIVWVGAAVIPFASAVIPASAEENLQGSTKLEDISIYEETVNDQQQLTAKQAYESFDAVDSGLSVISQEAIEIYNQGSNDTSELLNVLPFVELDVERYEGSAQAEQHIRPSDFSISGGKFYDNNISIDGVSINSVMDVVSTDEDQEDYDDVNGSTAQTFYIDPSLLGAVQVYDSNVSAEHGNFSGGAVDFQVRDPKDTFHASISGGIQKDEMIYYIGQDKSGDYYPDFLRYNTSASFDLPLTEKLKVLVAYSRSESAADYYRGENYGFAPYTNSDVSENYLVKAIYEINDDLESEFMFSTSPYSSEHTSANSANSERKTKSDGLITYLGFSGYHFDYDWNSKLSYNKFDTGRDWDGDRYKWDASSDYGSSLCFSDASCFEGGYGDLYQTQEDYKLDFTASTDLLDGTIRFGTESTYTRAYRERPQDNAYYSQYVLSSSHGIDCEVNDPACMSDIAFTSKTTYDQYVADVGVYQQVLWTEYEREFGSVLVRGGLRYDYENYLNNHNVSPRFVTSWEFYSGYDLTLGANRYYTRNTVAYAIKDATPATTTYKRTLNSDGTLSDWAFDSSGVNYDYSDSDLKTPYSDEITAALTVPTFLDGSFRIKGVKRFHRDQFLSSQEWDSGVSNWTLTNDGKTDYQAIALEWGGQLNKDHALSASVRWQETNTFGETYMSTDDIDELQNHFIYYDGRVMSEYDLKLLENPDNYATPVKANLTLTSSWWSNRLLTSLGVVYRGSYDTIDETGTYTEVGGTDYEIYEKDKVNSYTEVNLNSKLEVYRTAQTSTVLSARVTNLFNTDPYSESSTYRKGRAFWLGATVDFW